MSMTIQQAIENRERCYKYLIGCGPRASTENVEAVRLSLEALREKAERENHPEIYTVRADLSDKDLQELKDMMMGAGKIMVVSADPASIEIIPQWIPVAERLPDVGCDVLFVCQNKSYGVGMYSDTYRDFFSGQFPVDGVTHWMPLPEAPKEVQK